MNKRQREKIEKRLLEERQRVLHNMAEFDERFAGGVEDGEITHYPLHMADDGTDTMEQEKEFLLASQDGRQLYAIDEALRRLYRTPKTFGLCERCGQPISIERLDIVPWATLCVNCKTEMESSSEEDEDRVA